MSLPLQSHNGLPEPAEPLVEELTPAPDPWDTARRLAHWPHLLFLDSAAADSPFGRYSFVSADPFEWLQTRGGAENPFPQLAERLALFRTQTLPGLPPFQGGIAGLFGYDLCHHVERLPRPRFDEFALPDCAVGLYDCLRPACQLSLADLDGLSRGLTFSSHDSDGPGAKFHPKNII